MTDIPARIDFDKYAAGFYRAMAHLDQATTKELDNAGIDVLLRELVRIRASQLNGCAFCIDMHTKDARAAGETEQRIYALPAWRETPFFTDAERADQPDRDDQRLERDRRYDPRLAAGLVPALIATPRGPSHGTEPHRSGSDSTP